MGITERISRRRITVLVLFIAVATLAIGFQALRSSRKLQFRTAQSAARAYAAALTTYRDFYIEEVMKEAKGAGIELPYPSHGKEGALPLAYEFAIDLGDKLADDEVGGRYRIYSDFPWPERKNGGAHSEPERNALDALMAGEPEYSQILETDDGHKLLYAEPIRMKSFCVKCHNEHPASPRRNWKEGDVRGVLAVKLAIADPPLIPASSELVDVFSFVLLTIVLLATLAVMATAYAKLLAERHRDAELATVLHSIADAVLVVDDDGRIREANPAAENALGLSRRTLQGREVSTLLRTDDEAWTSTVPTPIKVTRGDGRRRELVMRVGQLKTDQPGYVVSLRDDRGLLRAQQRAADAQRWESIGSLCGGVAHDFNNIMVVIVCNSELLLLDSQLNKESRERLEEIQEAAQHAANLTKQLLAFGRKQALTPENVCLNDLVQRISGLLSRVLSEDHRIVTHGLPDARPVWVDSQQLDLALLNLAINARDATPDGGEVTIRVVQPADADFMAIEVCDEGPGIPEALRAQVVEPFFTTKETGAGTGLGLSTVQGFVEQSGGRLEIDDTPTGGALVRLVLPVSAVAAESALQARRMTYSTCPDSDQVLLVDDNPDVRFALGKQLEHHGYKVTSAGSVTEAVGILQKSPGFSVHLLDVRLGPGQCGIQIAEEAKRLNKEAPTIFMSGYLEGEELDRIRMNDQWVLLSKPFSGPHLHQTIRETQAASGHAHATG